MRSFEKNFLSPVWRFILAVLILLSGAAIRADEVFRWQDDRGRAHYSDHAVTGADRLPIETSKGIDSAAARHRVAKVYDGDTLLLEDGGKVRLLGINTPEISHYDKDGEPGGEEARRWLEERLAGRTVRLEQDAEKRDRYQRLLAHVFTVEGEHINRMLAETGLAFVDIHPPNFKYANALIEAQRQAEGARRGVWGMREYAPKPVEVLRNSPFHGWLRLIGRPMALVDGRNYQRLVFSKVFEVHIPREHLSLFSSPDRYVGRTVELRGWVSRREGKSAMVVRHPSALVGR